MLIYIPVSCLCVSPQFSCCIPSCLTVHPKSHIVWVVTTIEFEVTLRIVNKYIPCSMNMSIMKFRCRHVTVIWLTSVSCIASPPFKNCLLLWSHGIMKCQLNAHFRISAEVVLLVIEVLFTFCLSNSMNLDLLLFWYTVFISLYREVFNSGHSIRYILCPRLLICFTCIFLFRSLVFDGVFIHLVSSFLCRFL